jgi:cyclopropane-fatty-acyl-phospholipid synthase
MWSELLGRKARALAAGVAAHARPAALTAAVARLAEAVRQRGGLPLILEMRDGDEIRFGDSVSLRLRVRDSRALAALAAPSLAALGEAFIEGQIEFEGDIAEAIRIAAALSDAGDATAAARAPLRPVPHLPGQDCADARFHDDVGNAFYRLWLDERMVYSCARFHRGDEDIDTAQRDRLDHICRTLRLSPGERLLDIGCGWGGLVLHAAREYGVQAIGITLSSGQLAWARSRIAAERLNDRVEVLTIDYRELLRRFGPASFDKVSSVGMVDHVGLRNLPAYFAAVAGVLRDRGLFLSHRITSADVDSGPMGSGVGAFADRHALPRDELPHLHATVRDASAHGFEVAAVESLRPHYAQTLRLWSQRLEAQLASAAQLIDARRLRFWRLYLGVGAHGFRQGWINAYQVLLSRQVAPGPTGLPLTRQWIYR